jgi:hypothetical protein
LRIGPGVSTYAPPQSGATRPPRDRVTWIAQYPSPIGGGGAASSCGRAGALENRRPKAGEGEDILSGRRVRQSLGERIKAQSIAMLPRFQEPGGLGPLRVTSHQAGAGARGIHQAGGGGKNVIWTVRFEAARTRRVAAGTRNGAAVASRAADRTYSIGLNEMLGICLAPACCLSEARRYSWGGPRRIFTESAALSCVIQASAIVSFLSAISCSRCIPRGSGPTLRCRRVRRLRVVP